MTLYLVVGIIVLLALIALAIGVVVRARNIALQTDDVPHDELAEFQQMRDEGKITETEYNRLKRIVAEQTVKKIKGR